MAGGSTGPNRVLGRIDVSFRELQARFRPKDHIAELRSLLPKKYSPLRPNGDGLQSVYLTEVDRPFAAALYRLIGAEAREVADVANAVGAADRASQRSRSGNNEWRSTSRRIGRSPRRSGKPSSSRVAGRDNSAQTCSRGLDPSGIPHSSPFSKVMRIARCVTRLSS